MINLWIISFFSLDYLIKIINNWKPKAIHIRSLGFESWSWKIALWQCRLHVRIESTKHGPEEQICQETHRFTSGSSDRVSEPGRDRFPLRIRHELRHRFSHSETPKKWCRKRTGGVFLEGEFRAATDGFQTSERRAQHKIFRSSLYSRADKFPKKYIINYN